MIQTNYFLSCLLLLVSSLGVAQTLSTKNSKAIALYNEADNYKVRGQFEQAIKLLKQAIDKDKKFEEAYYRLGITYRVAGDRDAASEWLEKGLALVHLPIKQKGYLDAMGENYLRNGKYEKAKQCLEKFLAIEKTDRSRIDRAILYQGQVEYGLAHQNENLGYRIKQLSDTVNKYPMQYFPAITADGHELIFTVRYGSGHDDNEDIFVSKLKEGKWQDPVSLSNTINTEYREGSCSISADGRHLIFTICGPRGCDLYESKKRVNCGADL